MTTLIVAGAGAVAAVIVFVVLPSILIIVTEYERAVFFRLGHIREGAKGPGIVVRIPAVDRVVKVTLRVEVAPDREPRRPPAADAADPCRGGHREELDADLPDPHRDPLRLRPTGRRGDLTGRAAQSSPR